MNDDRIKKSKELKKMNDKPKINDVVLFNVFGKSHDRFDFPANIHRVTSGNGGETFLIIGSEKTALYDCGMAYCGKATVENIKDKLAEQNRRQLDFVFLSHSHYDHIGALPYIREAFPGVCVFGGEKAQRVLQRPNARKLIKELGTSARDLFLPGSTEEIPVDGLGVDIVLHDGDEVSFGRERIVAMETKGHTDCSMSYAFEPARLLFASESTGMLEIGETVHTPFLKSYSDAVNSMKKCMAYQAEYLCLPHFGLLPKNFNEQYWEMLAAACEEKLAFIGDMHRQGLTDEEMLKRYVDKYWDVRMEQIQPMDAFLINSKAIIKAFLKAV